MHGLQGSFPRCKKQLPSDNYKWRLVLESIVLVHNSWTDLVGSNQIQTIFDPGNDHIINLERYDQIARPISVQKIFVLVRDSDDSESQ